MAPVPVNCKPMQLNANRVKTVVAKKQNILFGKMRNS